MWSSSCVYTVWDRKWLSVVFSSFHSLLNFIVQSAWSGGSCGQLPTSAVRKTVQFKTRAKYTGESLFISLLPQRRARRRDGRNEGSGRPLLDLLSIWMWGVIQRKWNHMVNYPIEKARRVLKETLMMMKLSGSSNEAVDWMLSSSQHTRLQTFPSLWRFRLLNSITCSKNTNVQHVDTNVLFPHCLFTNIQETYEQNVLLVGFLV